MGSVPKEFRPVTEGGGVTLEGFSSQLDRELRRRGRDDVPTTGPPVSKRTDT